MNIRKGMIAGLGVASLLIALPAAAQSDTSSGSSSGSATDRSGSAGGSYGTGSQGATGSSSSMGMGTSTAQNQITGKVEKFDPATKELSLRLKVSDTTQVIKNGQRASLSDIKEGDYVRASFTGSGDTLQVHRIDVMSSSPSGVSPPGGAPSGAPPSGAPGSTGPSGPSGSSGRGY